MSQPLGLRSRRSLAIALATTLSTALATTLGTPLSISALPAAALATPLTRLELADTDVINQELRTDPVRVIVNYDRDEAGWTNSLSYQIFYNDLLKVEDSQETSFQSSISLQDLDQNGTAEVITETLSTRRGSIRNICAARHGKCTRHCCVVIVAHHGTSNSKFRVS